MARGRADPGALDAHPLVRAYFGDQLQEQYPEVWQAGHERLFEHFREAAPDLPDTLEEMMPLFQAVVHGCRSGKHQVALDDVFFSRVRRSNEHYSVNKMGVWGADLAALAAFFESPWDTLAAGLDAADKAFILNEAGMGLRAFGRLSEAVQPFQAALEAGIDQENWKAAAIRASNLSGLYMILGEVELAVEIGRQCVELAELSGDAFWRLANRTKVADALRLAALSE